jgi:glutamate N-acetyltransferase/amino-acid N-acetyltransferase
VKGILFASNHLTGRRRDAISASASQLRRDKNRVSTSGHRDWDAAARAIMTTDLTVKQKWITVKHDGKSFVVGGIAKGSGMIHPNMATMLAFVVTDLGISKSHLRKSVVQANRLSFNRISVDGDTSTNDMAMVMANGASGLFTKSSTDSLLTKFQTALNAVFIHLAKEIVIDGEGATKLVTCRVTGARSEGQAEKVAKTVIGSSLFKTMIHGEDPNWGRVIAVAGYSGEKIDQRKLNLWFGAEHIFKCGQPLSKAREILRAPLLKREVKIRIDLGQGKAEATCWGCDLSYEYVKINTAYS